MVPGHPSQRWNYVPWKYPKSTCHVAIVKFLQAAFEDNKAEKKEEGNVEKN